MITPLDRIGRWIKSLADKECFWIESEIATRAELAGPTLDDYSECIDRYLHGTKSVFRILSRTIIIRAIVDHYLWSDSQVHTEELLLDAVEMASPFVKARANAVLADLPSIQRDKQRTADTWIALRDEWLSDFALSDWESQARPPLSSD